MNDTFTQCVEFAVGLFAIIFAILIGVILTGLAFALTIAPFIVAYKFLVWIF